MWALDAIKLVRPRATGVTDAMLEVSLHIAVGAGAVRSHCAVTLRTAELSLSVRSDRLIYRDGVPSLVGPEFAIFDHNAILGPARGACKFRGALSITRAMRTDADAIWLWV